jgi:hypothetical protein
MITKCQCHNQLSSGQIRQGVTVCKRCRRVARWINGTRNFIQRRARSKKPIDPLTMQPSPLSTFRYT